MRRRMWITTRETLKQDQFRHIDKENEYKSTIERRYAGEGVYWCFHRSETESTIFGYSESVIT